MRLCRRRSKESSVCDNSYTGVQGVMAGLSQVRKTASGFFTEPIVRVLARTPITPNSLTWFGFALAIGAAVLIAMGHLIIAGVIVLFGGFFDMLDGALARRTKRVTLFGSILDSTLDRFSEGALLLGVGKTVGAVKGFTKEIL